MLRKQIRGSDAPPLTESLPNVQSMSDVIWIVWVDVSGAKASTLKYIFRYEIVTADTKARID